VTLGLAGTVVVGLAGAVVLRLGKPEIELVMELEHPAVRHTTTRTATGRESLFAEHRMLILPMCSRPAAGACDTVSHAKVRVIQRTRYGC
jgi:hypothetical protein